LESLEVKIARLEEHMVHMKGDTRAIRTAIEPLGQRIGDLEVQRAVDLALRRRDKKWAHGITAVIAAVFGWIGHMLGHQ
jgi:hypothetical protein